MNSIGKMKINEWFSYVEFFNRHKEDDTVGYLVAEGNVLYFQLDEKFRDHVDHYDAMPQLLSPDFEWNMMFETRERLAEILDGRKYGSLFLGPKAPGKIRVHRYSLYDDDYITIDYWKYHGDIIFFRKGQLEDGDAAISYNSFDVLGNIEARAVLEDIPVLGT